MFKKKADKPNPQIVAELQKKEILTWTSEDVGKWLGGLGYGEYSAKFLKNQISGQELVTLTSSELRAIGVTAVGHQKAILGKLASFTADQKAGAGAGPAQVKDQSHKSEADLSSVDDNSESQSSSAATAANRLELLLIYGDSRRIAVVKKAYAFERVLAKLEDIFSFAVEVSFKGAVIDNAVAWSECVSRQSSTDPLELAVQRENPNKIHKEEMAMLHGLTDVCFIIDTVGTILFQNFAAEDVLGYSAGELVGKNIKSLTPPEIRAKHDTFLKRYLETGNAKVIGTGRQVQVIHQKGHEVSCWLSVTEQKKATGRHTFMGTLHEIKSREAGAQNAKFAILDGVQEAVLVINSLGVMQFMNGRMEKLLGYSKDTLGRNISSIMPEPYASNHDSYLRNYLKSGTPKVIGRGGRVVVAKHFNGSVVPVHLEVDECILEGQRYFVGVMTPKDAGRKKKMNLLERSRQVVEQLAVPAIVINQKGLIQVFNASASALLGFDPADCIGKNVVMLMQDADAKHHDGYLARHIQTGENRIVGKFRNVQAKTKSGKILEVTLSVSKAVDPDDMANVLFTGTLLPSKGK